MPSHNTEHRNLHTTGLLTVAVLVICGIGLSFIPDLFKSKQLAYVCRIPLGTGVGGLEKGNSVLVGGLSRGEVTAIRTIAEGEIPAYFEVGFLLDQQVPLRPDAEIQKYVGISGGNTLLNVIDLGSPEKSWPDDQRALPLSTKENGAAALLGIPISDSIRNSRESATRLGNTLPGALERMEETVRAIPPEFSAIRSRVDDDLEIWQQDLSALQGRGRELIDRFDEARPEYDRFSAAARPILDIVEWIRGPVAERVAAIRRRIEFIRSTFESIRTSAEPIRANYTQAVADGRKAIATANRSIERLQEIAPEINDTSGRIFARSSLAGGQLKRLLDSALSTGIEAILIRPDQNSLSRRQFIESIENTLLATYSLRAAARTLDGFMDRNEEMLRTHPELAAILAKTLEQRITRMNENLQQLYDFVIRNMP